ncbi:MAG: response regulator transcription factor [bacterium]
MKILIVEDESSIREFEAAYLQKAGYETDEAENGEDAIDMFYDNKYDMVLLDINLPRKDGIEVCKSIRRKSNLPIIMVTAKVEEIDELVGLEVGADDYIKKPFSPAILVARVNNLLRRNGDVILENKIMSIDPEKVLVTVKNKEINLTTTEFNILYTLARTPGKVFSRNQILDKSYDLPSDVFDRTVDAHIKNIRKKLKVDDSIPDIILTVIGKGYKFNEIN